MKSSILFFVLLSSYCYCEQLLGGWSTSDDESFKSDCLNRALVSIYKGQLTDDIKTQVSDLNCQTQIVNGLNIKCTFVLRGQKWQCSYYKSFVQTLETQLEGCRNVTNEEKVEGKDDEQKVEETDDEQSVKELGTASEDDKVQQPLIANENEEEQTGVANEGEKEDQAVQEPSVSNEEDDEAKIDAMNNQLSKQNANNNEDEQQP